jgi:hypothetical protein
MAIQQTRTCDMCEKKLDQCARTDFNSTLHTSRQTWLGDREGLRGIYGALNITAEEYVYDRGAFIIQQRRPDLCESCLECLLREFLGEILGKKE